MTEYSYKVIMTNDECLADRAVAFHDDRFLRFEQMQKVAEKHLTSQTCPRCNKNHREHDYIVTDVERGEPDGHGGFYYRDVLPGDRRDYPQLELVYNG